jgi:hypothetical protein
MIRSCTNCSGKGLATGYNGDPELCSVCHGDTVVQITDSALMEDLDAVLHDMNIKYPPMRKSVLREIYKKLRALHDV